MEVHAAGVDSDRQWLLQEAFFDLSDVFLKLCPLFDIARLQILVILVLLARLISTCVAIVFVEDSSTVLPVLIDVLHPATLATVGWLIAVNLMLLGDTWGRTDSSLGSNRSLHGRSCREGPAGTAATLVLNGTHAAICSVINVDCVSDESSSMAVATIAVSSIGAFPRHAVNGLFHGLNLVESHNGHLLFLSAVRKHVMLQSEGVGAA